MIERAGNEILVVSPSIYWLSNGGFTDREIILHGLYNCLDKLQSLSVPQTEALKECAGKFKRNFVKLLVHDMNEFFV